MTVYERIKSMTLEEMAQLLDNFEEVVPLICNSRYCPVVTDSDAEITYCTTEQKNQYCHQATINFLNSKAAEK